MIVRRIKYFIRSTKDYFDFIDIKMKEKDFLPQYTIDARKDADFDLATHMKSIKNDQFPLKPLCDCLYCKSIYYYRLYNKEYRKIDRNIRSREREEARKQKEIELFGKIKFRDVESVDSKISILKQKDLRNYYKQKIKRYTKLAKQLSEILKIPNNG